MRVPMVAGNWKLNGTRSSAVELAGDIAKGISGSSVEVLVCPVYVHLSDVAEVVSQSAVKIGAQNASIERQGAFTGEVAPDMLAEFGCEYVILGHSERRSMFGDSDEIVAQKFVSAQSAGLVPILCVGETLEERETGQAEAVIGSQLDAVVGLAGIDAFANCVVAYEPVWAIGTGKTASPQQAQDVHAFIRQKLSALNADVAAGLRVLYGGSVKPDNAEELFSMADIDGGLIGGAALNSEDFLAICAAASAG
ncbi:unnamed protein product [Cyprideis torosa]|uniref:Triosephosphate isomerase n=1 Tax=Cyprideis torosa TaxID=163714 RepID=A0A7R8W1H2_9CRUS|nr:unnamed protein product [Cyprideis torosa]CAG0878753.1 unnamed protein product [Cyprideis torosa]